MIINQKRSSPLRWANATIWIAIAFLIMLRAHYCSAANGLSDITGGIFNWNKPQWSPSSLPNPMLDPLKCGRHSGVARSVVCDPEKLLSSESQDEVEGHINAITEKTGAQVAVVIISKMDPLYGEAGAGKESAAERFSVELHQLWGVGSSEKNDGVLVFLAISDRVLYISTGAGLRDTISSKIIQGIIGNMRPHLKKKRYDIAVIDCVITIGQLIAGESDSSFAHYMRSRSSSSTDWITVIGFIGFLALTVYLGIRQSRQLRNYERGRRALDNLMHEVENTAANNKYFASSCPICLEDLSTEQLPDVVYTDGNTATSAAASKGSALHGGDDIETKENDDFKSETENTAVVSDAVKKTPMALRCGHTFCRDCLVTYLRSNEGTRCPICRYPVHDDYSQPSAPDDPSIRRRPTSDVPTGSSNGTSCASTMASDSSSDVIHSDVLPTSAAPSSHTRSSSSDAFVRRAPEIRYRLGRIRHLYPDVMTAALLRSMNSAVDRGSLTDFRTGIEMRSREVQERVTEIRRASAEAARRSGSRGHSGGGFGGGRSSGGGGGSW